MKASNFLRFIAECIRLANTEFIQSDPNLCSLPLLLAKPCPIWTTSLIPDSQMSR